MRWVTHAKWLTAPLLAGVTVLLAVVAVVLAVELLVVYRRLQDAEYWRAHWRRRYDERDAVLSAALSEGQDFRANVEQALRTLWRHVKVVTLADGAAVAVLRAAFPSLPLPGPQPRPPARSARMNTAWPGGGVMTRATFSEAMRREEAASPVPPVRTSVGVWRPVAPIPRHPF